MYLNNLKETQVKGWCIFDNIQSITFTQNNETLKFPKDEWIYRVLGKIDKTHKSNAYVQTKVKPKRFNFKKNKPHSNNLPHILPTVCM